MCSVTGIRNNSLETGFLNTWDECCSSGKGDWGEKFGRCTNCRKKKYLDDFVRMLLSPGRNELCWSVVETALVKSRGLVYQSTRRTSSKCTHRNKESWYSSNMRISHLYGMSNDSSRPYYTSYCECTYRLIYIQKHPPECLIWSTHPFESPGGLHV